jgi:hypothetical protein
MLVALMFSCQRKVDVRELYLKAVENRGELERVIAHYDSGGDEESTEGN